MDYFEGIVKTLLEHEGYWVRQSFKVNLSKQEKRDIGKHSIPRPEIDLLAFKPVANELLALEVKSYFDSPGLKLEYLKRESEIPEGRYKLFTSENYRQIVFRRLKQDLLEAGMVNDSVKIRLGLIAGNVYQGRSEELRDYLFEKGWFFWSPQNVKDRVVALAAKSYENEPAIITAKILMR